MWIPRYYGEVAARDDEVDAARTRRLRDSLARQALDGDLPLLAICRGVQVLNVVAGGTLVQDMPHSVRRLSHRSREPKNADRARRGRRARNVSGASAGRPVDARNRAVNSRHHQSVDDVAPGFVVSATAPDGVVEAIERRRAFCLGVQWHPENFWRTGEFSPLFDSFIAAARAPTASESRKISTNWCSRTPPATRCAVYSKRNETPAARQGRSQPSSSRLASRAMVAGSPDA